MRWLRRRWQERPWWVVKWVVGLIIIAFLAFALRNAWVEATNLLKVLPVSTNPELKVKQQESSLARPE